MIFITIMLVLVVVLTSYSLHSRINLKQLRGSSNTSSPVHLTAIPQGSAMRIVTKRAKADARAKARRRAVKNARRANRKPKPSARKRKHATCSKRRHGRPRGR